MSEEINPVEQVRILTRQLEDEKKKVGVLEQRLRKYEQDGVAKLYYSLLRKSNEMAEMLNSVDLKEVNMDDPKIKTFDRIRAIIADSSDIAIAVKSLGDSAGVTGDEKKDVARKPFVDTIAEARY